MKKLLLVFGIAGSSILVSGQAPTSQPRLTAEHVVSVSNNLWHFSGAVRIEVANVVITADEADGRSPVPGGPMELELRGNVHLNVTPTK